MKFSAYLLLSSAFVTSEVAMAQGAPATYTVKLVAVSPPKLAVTADLPSDGDALTMDTTRPGGIPELDTSGWPGLVSNLSVTDTASQPIATSRDGAAGWRLAEARQGRLRVAYDVDYAALASRGWPAPRETGLVGADHLVLPCRSIFVATPAVRESVVSFELPKGWRPVTPWGPDPKSTNRFTVQDASDLVTNILVIARSAPDVVSTGGFRLQVVAMGPWEAARKEVRRVLDATVPRLVELIGASTKENYLVVLLPVADDGAESYRHSFALTFPDPPSRANSANWGHLIAHEVFHLWNGWRLEGADYPTTQWFHEGFTEYAADLAAVGGKLFDENRFLQTLTKHVANYRRLKTTLEGSGTHKGPPLYSAGALVAFSWDVTILEATGGKRAYGDFLRALWKQTDEGRKPYTWADIKAALDATATHDWQAYYDAHIRGAEPLPLALAFSRAGLILTTETEAKPRLAVDASAPAKAKDVWHSLLSGR